MFLNGDFAPRSWSVSPQEEPGMSPGCKTWGSPLKLSPIPEFWTLKLVHTDDGWKSSMTAESIPAGYGSPAGSHACSPCVWFPGQQIVLWPPFSASVRPADFQFPQHLPCVNESEDFQTLYILDQKLKSFCMTVHVCVVGTCHWRLSGRPIWGC